MTNLFYIQLITSFIAGGITIAGLSYFAERAPKKIAGIVISLPSTVVITYIFIGWTLSAEDVGRIAPATLMMGGVVQLFAIVYIYLSKIKLPKILSIIMTGFVRENDRYCTSLALLLVASVSGVVCHGITSFWYIVCNYYKSVKNSSFFAASGISKLKE